MERLCEVVSAAHLRHLRLVIFVSVLLPAVVQGQSYPGHRITIGRGTLLLIPDSLTGLTIWARRETRPGYRPSPDFVGWFDHDSVSVWIDRSRQLLAGGPPDEGDKVETPPLVARDGGTVALMRFGDPGDPCCALAFGHPRERQRWIIESSTLEILRLLDTLDLLSASTRLHPPTDLGYANPTNRRATPDRKAGPLPVVTGEGGEIWARATLNEQGEVIPGSGVIVWASRAELGRAVLEVLPGYRYQRKDGGRPGGLVVYQRFRVSGEK